MYWVERGDTCRFIKRDVDDNNSIFVSGAFSDVRWIHCSKRGDIYFIDVDDLCKITKDGKFQLLFPDLSSTTIMFFFVNLRHNVMGIWSDEQENIYVAVYCGQCIK